VSNKNIVSGKMQLTGKLHISTVRHLNTPAEYKHYNTLKYSYNRDHAWTFPIRSITLEHSALTISNTMYLNEQLTYIMGLWMPITTGQEMFL
jgi:hypothetical protein